MEASTVDSDRVFEQTSLLIDGGLERDQVVGFNQILESSQSARQTYLQYVQLHADLVEHFRLRDVRFVNDPFLEELLNAGPAPKKDTSGNLQTKPTANDALESR